MNNKNILRTALPFIAIFFISLCVAGYTFIQKNLPGARAGEDIFSVTAVNTRSPLATNDEWQWTIITSSNNRPADPVSLTYVVTWCLRHDATAPCIEKQSEDFFYQIGKGTLTVNARETIQKITHQSINCGRVNVEISRDGKVITRGAQSTNKQCTRDLANNVSAYANSPTDLIDLISSSLRLVMSLLSGGDTSGGDNPGGSNPGGTNPVGGDVCSSAGATCQEVYREACGEGDQTGTRVCYKYGVCSGPGSGVQCSWGAGSWCEKCEPGISINDPVPAIKPPQGAEPGAPGDPGGGTHPRLEPIPPPSNADAQKATTLANYIRQNCKFPNYDYGGREEAGLVANYNADTCMAHLSGTSNDNQARYEVIASAKTFTRLQCVGFSEAALAAATGQSYNGPSGHAGERTYSAGNFQYVPIAQGKPGPNDIAVWDESQGMPKGHNAYVIEGDSQIITVLEANYVENLPNGKKKCFGCVRKKTYILGQESAERRFAGFLRKK